MTDPKNNLPTPPPSTLPETIFSFPAKSQLATLNSSPALPDLCFPGGAIALPQPRPGAKPRNGKIAHLPRLERDMVNRMLANNLPQETIVAALDELGFHVTQRNVPNWKTRGGYKEWCAA